MKHWSTGDTVVVRYIARSDGTVGMALPTIAIRDDAEILALYVPPNTTVKDNYVVPAAQRVAAIDTMKPSRQRQHIDRTWPTAALGSICPGKRSPFGSFSTSSMSSPAGMATWKRRLSAHRWALTTRPYAGCGGLSR